MGKMGQNIWNWDSTGKLRTCGPHMYEISCYFKGTVPGPALPSFSQHEATDCQPEAQFFLQVESNLTRTGRVSEEPSPPEGGTQDRLNYKKPHYCPLDSSLPFCPCSLCSCAEVAAPNGITAFHPELNWIKGKYLETLQEGERSLGYLCFQSTATPSHRSWELGALLILRSLELGANPTLSPTGSTHKRESRLSSLFCNQLSLNFTQGPKPDVLTFLAGILTNRCPPGCLRERHIYDNGSAIPRHHHWVGFGHTVVKSSSF